MRSELPAFFPNWCFWRAAVPTCPMSGFPGQTRIWVDSRTPACYKGSDAENGVLTSMEASSMEMEALRSVRRPWRQAFIFLVSPHLLSLLCWLTRRNSPRGRREGSYHADCLPLLCRLERALVTNCLVGADQTLPTDQLRLHFWERLKRQLG